MISFIVLSFNPLHKYSKQTFIEDFLFWPIPQEIGIPKKRNISFHIFKFSHFHIFTLAN